MRLVTAYEEDLQLFPDFWHRVGWAFTILALVAFFFLANAHWMSVGLNVFIAITGAVSMMVLTGFCGQISLGHAAFLAIGAYTTAILGQAGMPFWLTIPFAGLLAAGVGLAVGPFAFRLEGLYLALVTIGLLFVTEHLLRNGLEMAYGKDYLTVPMHWTFVSEGKDGLGAFREATALGPLKLDVDRKLFVLFVALCGFAVWMGKNLQRSASGRAMMAVRDQDLAAAALGVNPARAKLAAFGVSSFLAGITGAMYAFAHPVLTLEPFNLMMSVEYIAMVVLGGVGAIFGAVSGALAYVGLKPLFEQIGLWLPFPEAFSSEHQAVILFFPLMIGFLVFEPMGILGIWLRIKRYFLAWPFRY
jgi:branched-chain amino acid transport system permease protein